MSGGFSSHFTGFKYHLGRIGLLAGYKAKHPIYDVTAKADCDSANATAVHGRTTADSHKRVIGVPI